MYILYGIVQSGWQEKIGGNFKAHYSKEKVALFTTKEKAKNYVNKYKLKHPKSGSFGDGDTIFKANSLLCCYSDYEINKYYKEELEIDPI